jgi:hypothetical protein
LGRNCVLKTHYGRRDKRKSKVREEEGGGEEEDVGRY